MGRDTVTRLSHEKSGVEQPTRIPPLPLIPHTTRAPTAHWQPTLPSSPFFHPVFFFLGRRCGPIMMLIKRRLSRDKPSRGGGGGRYDIRGPPRGSCFPSSSFLIFVASEPGRL